MIAPHKSNRAKRRRRTDGGCVATSGAGSSSASSHGFSGNVGSWFAGSTTRPISLASCSLRPYASCSNNFEIGSSYFDSTVAAVTVMASAGRFYSASLVRVACFC